MTASCLPTSSGCTRTSSHHEPHRPLASGDPRQGRRSHRRGRPSADRVDREDAAGRCDSGRLGGSPAKLQRARVGEHDYDVGRPVERAPSVRSIRRVVGVITDIEPDFLANGAYLDRSARHIDMLSRAHPV